MGCAPSRGLRASSPRHRLTPRHPHHDPQRQLNRDGLDHLLATRPSAAELQETGILHAPPGVSANLVARQEALEKQLLLDAMNHQLATRPPAEVLHQQGILKSAAPGVSGKIAADAERLQRRRASDALKASLASRPSPVKLMQVAAVLCAFPPLCALPAHTPCASFPMQEGILRDPSGGDSPGPLRRAFEGI